MDKNQFYLYNEILYKLLTCTSLDSLRRTFLRELRLLIPYRYGSIITISQDPETGKISHSDPVCIPEEFTELEEAWIDHDQDDAFFWLSSSQESIVLRGSEVQSDEVRLGSVTYRTLYQRYNIYDQLGVNLVYDKRPMATMDIYRTREDQSFSDEDAFFLKSIIRHVNYLYHRLLVQQETTKPGDDTARRLQARYRLTQRETEITALLFQNLTSDEMAERLSISRSTLDKHLNSIYRKCGVSSRVKLLTLKEPV